MAKSFALKALPGFDWKRVKWGGPSQVRTSSCSYCGEPLDDSGNDGGLFTLSSRSGCVAEFCQECSRQWFGIESAA